MKSFHSSRVHPLGWEGASDLTFVRLQQSSWKIKIKIDRYPEMDCAGRIS